MKSFLLTVAILLPLVSTAQRLIVKLTESSSTSWSGGIAGKYGISYNFTVEFSGYRHDMPEPDTLWIGTKCIPIVLKSKPVQQNYNTIRTEGRKSISYLFIAGTNNEDAPNNITNTNTTNSKNVELAKLRPPINYSGVALVSYKYKGKNMYFAIHNIMKSNRPVNYP